MSFLSLGKTPQAPVVEAADMHCAAAWGMTAAEWQSLTDLQRVDYRDRVAHAPNLRRA